MNAGLVTAPAGAGARCPRCGREAVRNHDELLCLQHGVFHTPTRAWDAAGGPEIEPSQGRSRRRARAGAVPVFVCDGCGRRLVYPLHQVCPAGAPSLRRLRREEQRFVGWTEEEIRLFHEWAPGDGLPEDEEEETLTPGPSPTAVGEGSEGGPGEWTREALVAWVRSRWVRGLAIGADVLVDELGVGRWLAEEVMGEPWAVPA